MDIDPSNAELEAVQRLQSFFNSNALSDLTLRFSGRELKAHKVILCIHSQWFAKAFRGNFLEASQSSLELHNDNPQAVEGMIRHFYDLDPMSPSEMGRLLTPDQAEPSAKLKHIVHLYAVADKYDAPVLRKKVLSNFTILARKNWPTLWKSGELPDIIEAIYAFTVRRDRLRVATVEMSLGYIDKFRETDVDAFRELIETVPDFGADILMQVPLPSPVKLTPHFSETLVKEVTTYRDQLELHEAARLGDLAQCKLLVWRGIYVSARDINDSTPLHFAAFYGHILIVQFLVERARADINARCDNRAFPTPLAWAQYAEHHDIVDYLVDAGGLET